MAVKRLLSIDGGGIRGIIAAEVLVKMEDALQAYNPKWKRLCDYFDFISGTSTGSIIAAGLAKGMSAYELLDLYKTKGKQIFTPATYTDQDLDQILKRFKLPGFVLGTVSNLIKWSGKKEIIFQMLLNKYTGQFLEKQLRETLGENLTLGSPDLKTNLMVVTNNVTRGQNWFFVNNTVKRDYEKKSAFLELNAHIPLWKIVRASAAAPTFFPPFPFEVKVPKDSASQELIEQKCEFIDGGIGAYNNSSFQLFLEAVHPGYGTNWESGVDKLFLVSIGTGFTYADLPFGNAANNNNADWAGYIIGDLMYEANLQQNQLMKLISKQKFRGVPSLSETQDSFKLLAAGQELLTYCRFTTSLTLERFKKLTEKGYLELKDNNCKPIPADKITNDIVNKFSQMDCVDQIENLCAIGKAVAEEQFDLSLFEGFLEDC